MPDPELTDQLALMAGRFGSETAFVDLGSGRRVSFAEWDDSSNRLARRLAGLGIRPGDRVAIHLSSTQAIAWITSYAAIHRAGAVAVPVNTRLVAREVRAILGHAQVSAVVADPGTLAVLAAALAPGPLPSDSPGGDGPDNPRVAVVIALGADQAPFAPPEGPTVVGWDEALAGDGGPYQAPVGDDDVTDIVYTSGTTGQPKGVVVRRSNSSLLPNGLPGWTGVGWLTCSPLFTFAGLTAIDTPMKLGMTALYLPQFDAGSWLAAVEEHRPAMVFLVPAMAELLLADPGFEGADLSSIGLCAIGSAPLAPAVQRRLQARMPAAAVSNAYGMTEAGPAYTILPKEETERRIGSVGRPLPPAEFFVVDAEGRRLPAGEVGELVVHLPGRWREYYCDPVATARTWHDDGLHTGDLARVDEDGYVYLVGRVKEVIIRGGHNVYAADVEAVLYEHPDVAEAVVSGVPHPVLGEDVAAWVVVRQGRELDPSDLRAWAANRLADYKVPRRVALVRSLPRNATGKVVKTELAVPDLVELP